MKSYSEERYWHQFGIFCKMSPNCENFRYFEVALTVIFGLVLGLLMLISPWVALGAVILFSSLVGIIIKPISLCYFVIIATAFTSGMSRGQIIPFLIPNELILIVSIGLAFFIVLKRHYQSSPNLMTAGIVILALGTAVFPVFFYYIRGEPLSTREMLVLFAPMQYLLMYWLFHYLPQNATEIINLLLCMLVCAAVIAIFGFLQIANIGVVNKLLQTWYPSSHGQEYLQSERVTSLLGAWNSLGTFMMFNLLVIRALIGTALMKNKGFIVLLIALSLLGCLLASGSYAGLIGLGLGLILIDLFDPRGRKAILVLLIGIVILGVVFHENIMTRFTYQFSYGGFVPQTLAFRFMVWEDVFWPIVQRYWLWGFRPILPTTLAWSYTESQYVGLLVSSGIFALIAHLLWTGLALIWLWHGTRKGLGLPRSLSVGAFVLLIVLSIMGLTNAVFTYSGVMEYLWILLGLSGNSMEKIGVSEKFRIYELKAEG